MASYDVANPTSAKPIARARHVIDLDTHFEPSFFE